MTIPKSATKAHGLYAKILAVQQAIDTVPKRGFNAFHKYHYATEADILTVKEAINSNHLVVLPTVLDQQTGIKPDGKSWASVTLLFRVVDVDSEEAIESQFTGYAEDNFDKAIYKAMTGANKYFYLKFFGIATEDDPEREDAPAPTTSVNRGQPPVRSLNAPVASGSVGGSRMPESADGEALNKADNAADSEKRNEALINANKILALQKQYGLSNEAVLRVGEMASIRELAEAGKSDELAAAYKKLLRYAQQPVSQTS
ncbi:ERF family protein [Vampirovibrio sp.]|uniref:ERF family protein n=1 Tax=Vampirovibrio sp. TaxID=2717857 RepID=UPI0035940264